MIKAASLFTGIGAPEYATREMPYEWLWGAEIDKNPNTIMRHNFPTHINLGDVNERDFIERARECGRPDVMVFGSPCQSFSIAGTRGGLDDARGNLTIRALQIIDTIRPKWFLWENVPGVLSNGFGTVLKEIQKCGYVGAWRVLDAQFFGVPQRRRRLFFLGYCGHGREAEKVLFEQKSSDGHSASSTKEGQDSTRAIYEYHGQDSRVKETKNITPTLAQKMGTGGGNVPIIYRKGDLYTREYDSGIKKIDNEIARTITAQGKTDNGGTTLIYQVLGHDGARPLNSDKISTLQAARKGRGGSILVEHDEILRWMTPEEAEACQGFPKGYTDYVSQSARYRAIGNSMAVPVIEWILSRLAQQYAKKKI